MNECRTVCDYTACAATNLKGKRILLGGKRGGHVQQVDMQLQRLSDRSGLGGEAAEIDASTRPKRPLLVQTVVAFASLGTVLLHERIELEDTHRSVLVV